jgi:hypothetical protein|tara:strand:+ start:21440 stop:21637 length:198 start_codon:yes stop_codon:yes gene_type:complete
VLSQRFADPYIFAVVGADEQYKVVPGGIVGVKEICDYAQQAEAPRKEDKLILVAQLIEDVLLEFL